MERPKITLIGGGVMLLNTAKICAESFELSIIVSPRHYLETEEKIFKQYASNYCVIDNINESHNENLLKSYSSLCLCFGPAWIFDDWILDIFNGSIYNYNGIPLPAYLGGAHYSWQLMNDDKSGGCYIQQIISDVDRGKIVMGISYQLPDSVSTPADYFLYNHKKGVNLINAFLDRILSNDPILPNEYIEVDWDDISYFPRLFTEVNGWINWDWSGDDICKFCRAFASPYSGAKTKVEEHVIIIYEASHSLLSKPYHPYCIGLVIGYNNSDNFFRIATKDGELLLYKYAFPDQNNRKLRLGERLWTKIDLLETSMKRIKYGPTGKI